MISLGLYEYIILTVVLPYNKLFQYLRYSYIVLHCAHCTLYPFKYTLLKNPVNTYFFRRYLCFIVIYVLDTMMKIQVTQ